MDSQEINLQKGTTELNETENNTLNDNSVTEAPTVEKAQEESPHTDSPVERKVYTSKKEVLDRVKEIVQGEDNPDKEEVDYLKSAFYKMHAAEREANLKAFLESGADPSTYVVTPDETEEEFKANMNVIKERRAQLFKEQEEEKEANLKKKLDILEKLKEMASSPEEANRSYNDFKALQQEWKDIKNVPAPQVSELWRNYQLYVEQFYDMLKLNGEAREYDFKKNLEAKTALCEAAEKLAEEPDVIKASRQLQALHQEYREVGPVAKELREQIWARFKAASTVVNKRHQQYFDELRAQEEKNLVEKTALCEQLEAIIAQENKGTADWDKHAQEIIDLQSQWKTIGFTPQKSNAKIFERFRKGCDDFFTRKAAYFKEVKAALKANAEKKRALVEKAKELTDSDDWKATADKLVALQKEWKTIGPVSKKIGDQLWEEFSTTCNHFFEARKAATAGQRKEEQDNLKAKRDIVDQLKQMADSDDSTQAQMQKLIEEFNAIGHVPFKEKDKLFDDYHTALDELRKKLNIGTARKRLNNFKSKIKNAAEQGGNALDGERARLMRQYEAIKSEVQTYENNMGFLSASSKKGNSLVNEMNRRVQKLKDDMALVYEKIKAIDSEK